MDVKQCTNNGFKKSWFTCKICFQATNNSRKSPKQNQWDLPGNSKLSPEEQPCRLPSVLLWEGLGTQDCRAGWAQLSGILVCLPEISVLFTFAIFTDTSQCFCFSDPSCAGPHTELHCPRQAVPATQAAFTAPDPARNINDRTSSATVTWQIQHYGRVWAPRSTSLPDGLTWRTSRPVSSC